MLEQDDFLGLETVVEPSVFKHFGSLVLFVANRDGEDKPTPLNSFHLNMSDWVI